MGEEKEDEKRQDKLVENKKKKHKKPQQSRPKDQEETKEEKNVQLDKEEKSNEQPCKEQQQQPNKKRKRKEVFPYGNYRNYYGYRIGQDVDGDPRIKIFKKEWFEGKNCLDVGCNNGIITIQIAKEFHCQSILGIDIDSDRIEDSYWHLRKIVRGENSKRGSTKASTLKVAKNASGSEESATELSAEKKELGADDSTSKGSTLFDRVSFQRENFVQSQHPLGKQYDTILCLSVTKWIHLNWGDDGLITLFSKMWRLLCPGGILILEPQPWKSYEKNHLVSEITAMNYRTIIFRPEHFRDILLDKIGFRSIEDITADLSGAKTGFKRPLFVFHK